ncbi:protein MIZU-KUSSEI 1-like [Dioscorea cayenensis subsp. rotundata]|uniref:Protein MIZU-KUSSEI 1-like n=1 Tax=Dioscorea cayennensis subsp. rotundata TaxID=55577 RepID=A0AB40CGD1_DIOCR|nr:protein MIZU-KUSSEI 1-like [Dioscorea cayenensis subsp. rotundata]
MADSVVTSWWDLVSWVTDTVLQPCGPVIPLLFSRESPPTVVGTILCPWGSVEDNRLRLCLQKPLSPDPPLLLIDLPSCDLEGVCRITFECSAEHSRGGSLLDEPSWMVRCNGSKTGYGRRRAATKADMWALEAVRPVSTGAGLLLPPKLDSATAGPTACAFMYMRGSFERVIGSPDSESYHLVDPTGCLGPEISFFFLRG